MTHPVNYSTPVSWNEFHKWNGQAAPLSTLGFLIDTALVLEEQESMNLVTGYARVTGNDCVGTFYMTTCSLRSAIGIYNVTIDHDTVTLASEPPEIVAIANNANVDHTVSNVTHLHPSTLSGLVRLSRT